MCIPGKPELKLNFKKPQRQLGLVSGEKARKLLWNGAVGYLAYIVNQSKDKAQLNQVPIVREFPDIFPEELVNLPPEWKVEFVVELLLGAAPISKIQYRMAPAELQELKSQLQELMNKDSFDKARHHGVHQCCL